MSRGDFNPYASPAPDPGFPPSDAYKPWQIDYFGGFSVALQSPNWLANAFCCGLVTLIPIVGHMVGLGYAFEIAEALHRSHGRSYPDFSFNRFGDYLTRGVGPFLVQLLVGFLCAIPLVVVVVVMFAGMIAAAQGDPRLLDESMPFVHLGMQGVQLLMNVFVMTIGFPLMVRGGIAADVNQSFQFGEGWKMLSSSLIPCFLMSLIWNVAFYFLMPFGCLALCIGMFGVIGFMYAVMGWNGYQLYRYSLSQGLNPVPLKPMPPEATMPEFKS